MAKTRGRGLIKVGEFIRMVYVDIWMRYLVYNFKKIHISVMVVWGLACYLMVMGSIIHLS